MACSYQSPCQTGPVWQTKLNKKMDKEVQEKYYMEVIL